jgi:hypothetical protein
MKTAEEIKASLQARIDIIKESPLWIGPTKEDSAFGLMMRSRDAHEVEILERMIAFIGE